MGNRIALHNWCLLRGLLLWSLSLGSLSSGGGNTCSPPSSLVSLCPCELTSPSPQKSPLNSQDREGMAEGGVLSQVPLILSIIL